MESTLTRKSTMSSDKRFASLAHPSPLPRRKMFVPPRLILFHFVMLLVSGCITGQMFLHMQIIHQAPLFLETKDEERCPVHPFCEVSGHCQTIDISASPGWWYGRYPGLLNARIDNNKVGLINKEQLRNKHLRIRTIEMFLDGCGFFTFPLIVMNQLLVAHRLGLIGEDKKPFVYLPETHHYFDGQCGNSSSSFMLESDFWEKWFEPVGDRSWRDVPEGDVWEFSQASIQTIYYDPEGVHAYPYDRKRDPGTAEWIDEQRTRALYIMKEYNIQVKSELVTESKSIFRNLVGEQRALGLHMRGTDKFVTKKVDILEYDFQVDRFFALDGSGLLFLATDDQEYFNHIRERYGNAVRHLDVMREPGNILYKDSVDKDRKSKDVLLDMLVLSWVDTIVKTWSSVSEFSVYFRQARIDGNPFDSVVDLQLSDFDDRDANRIKNAIMVKPKDVFLSRLRLLPSLDTFLARESDILYSATDQELSRSRYLPEMLSNSLVEITDSEYLGLQRELDILTSQNCVGPSIQLSLVEFGLGSTLNSLVKPVQHAIKHGYCLKEPVSWKKFNCTSWNSLFAPFSDRKSPMPPMGLSDVVDLPIEPDNTQCDTTFSAPADDYNDFGWPTIFYSWEYQRCARLYSFSAHGVNMLPVSHQKFGLFASVSFILHYLYRPSPALEERIDREKAAMRWPADGTPILGIHYRAGDSCLEFSTTLGRRCDSFDVYMKEAQILQEKYGFRHIFLATDSDSLLLELKNYPNWIFHYVESVDRGGIRNVRTIDTILQEGQLDGCREATDAFLDTYLLGQCDAFLGKFSSNIDRIAYALLFARVRHHVPHVSLDNNWCFDYGIRSRPGSTTSWNPLNFAANQNSFYC